MRDTAGRDEGQRRVRMARRTRVRHGAETGRDGEVDAGWDTGRRRAGMARATGQRSEVGILDHQRGTLSNRRTSPT